MLRLLVLGAMAVGALWVAPGDDIEYSLPIRVPPVTVYRPPVSSSTSVPSSSVPAVVTGDVVWVDAPPPVESRWVAAPAGARCGEWWLAAQVAGWPADLLPVLDWVMWRESRCLPDVVGSGGFGLLQIQWSAHSWWITELGVDRADLLGPMWNLVVGWELWQRLDADPAFLCGWSAWYMSEPGRHWCTVEVDL